MKLLFKSIIVTVSILSSSFIMADNEDEIIKVFYNCENNKVMEVIYVNTAKDSYAMINQMDELIPMKIMKMASGANYKVMYKVYKYKLYTKGDKADLIRDNGILVLSNYKVG
ncbi:MliC family protein [Proteus mirabilis]|uniref:MliC family protein n=1 Tax=Proteus mirabilis TaxID=584 RepID=UPI001315D5B3|nr:MliC family protein [Proteus mirabilis]EKT9735221.1 MliC family protein [Proteus mirabilis]EKW6744554.1 MliC family protein [Proteus mirabilis]MBG2887908.1 MliC family protein [Proteus mirabilis]MBI6375620.1 MliC family protein [Proteus mirabilis]MDM3632182.1 MliC family protein [Proteus mirabilis]